MGKTIPPGAYLAGRGIRNFYPIFPVFSNLVAVTFSSSYPNPMAMARRHHKAATNGRDQRSRLYGQHNPDIRAGTIAILLITTLKRAAPPRRVFAAYLPAT